MRKLAFFGEEEPVSPRKLKQLFTIHTELFILNIFKPNPPPLFNRYKIQINITERGSGMGAQTEKKRKTQTTRSWTTVVQLYDWTIGQQTARPNWHQISRHNQKLFPPLYKHYKMERNILSMPDNGCQHY